MLCFLLCNGDFGQQSGTNTSKRFFLGLWSFLLFWNKVVIFLALSIELPKGCYKSCISNIQSLVTLSFGRIIWRTPNTHDQFFFLWHIWKVKSWLSTWIFGANKLGWSVKKSTILPISCFNNILRSRCMASQESNACSCTSLQPSTTEFIHCQWCHKQQTGPPP